MACFIGKVKGAFAEPFNLQALNNRIADGARPHFVNGRWNKPALSARMVAEYRKQYFVRGLEFPEIPKGYEVPSTKPPAELKLKGHKHIREAPLRQQKIAQNMAKMPKLIEEFRKNKAEEKHRARKPLDLFLRNGYSQLELKMLADYKKNKEGDQKKAEAAAAEKLAKQKQKEAKKKAQQEQEEEQPQEAKSE
ncbi:hypothetical protein PROFUN_00545 [Planoprotostelium fungivorum]|uniref:Large ribosomal subunit protein mL59 domain-containing protein n=1 Tax=Planoprotostelium fungivorum TaxID=1890364 RepID=A0A2P6N142_9EUKA|nr:hypothetical protein PROFUN_00545 [Planoprotostelium fungivorum]